MQSQLMSSPGFLKEALVDSLINSLWQGAFLVLAIWVFRRIYKPGPQIQYLISLTGLFSIALLSLWNFFSYNTIQTEFYVPLKNYMGLKLDGYTIHWIYTIWIIGTFIFFLRFVLSHIFLKKIIHKSKRVDHPQWLEQFERIKNHYHLGKNILLMHSDRISSAFLTGVVKPVVLIPTAWVNGLHPKEIECILAHEFSHIKSKDHWINLFIQVVEMVFYFNPSVHILISHIKLDRELLADQSANEYVQSPILYSKLILKVEEQTGKIPLFSIPFFKQKNQLRTRIEAVLNIASHNHHKENAVSLYAALSCLIFFAFQHSHEPIKTSITELIPLYTIPYVADGNKNLQTLTNIPKSSLTHSTKKVNDNHKRTKKILNPPAIQRTDDPETPEMNLSENVAIENTSFETQIIESHTEETNVVVFTQTEIKLDSLAAVDGDGAWIISKQGKSYQPKGGRSAIILRMETIKNVSTESGVPDTVQGSEKGNQSNQQ